MDRDSLCITRRSGAAAAADVSPRFEDGKAARRPTSSSSAELGTAAATGRPLTARGQVTAGEGGTRRSHPGPAPRRAGVAGGRTLGGGALGGQPGCRRGTAAAARPAAGLGRVSLSPAPALPGASGVGFIGFRLRLQPAPPASAHIAPQKQVGAWLVRSPSVRAGVVQCALLPGASCWQCGSLPFNSRLSPGARGSHLPCFSHPHPPYLPVGLSFLCACGGGCSKVKELSKQTYSPPSAQNRAASAGEGAISPCYAPKRLRSCGSGTPREVCMGSE